MGEIRNYNFFCVDCTCSESNKNFVLQATESEVNLEDFLCPNNRDKVLKPLGYKPSWSIGKFDAMSPDQKQGVLLKRSKEHYKKEISEQKYEKNKKLIEKFNS